MKVTEYLRDADCPLISFEIIPPKRGGHIQQIIDLIEKLTKYKPPFIDVTSHASEATYEETPNGIKRRIKRKRPGTIGICAIIQHKYGVDAVPHVLCRGFTKEETEDFLIDLKYLGIQNVLALQGDDLAYQKPIRSDRTNNDYSSDLAMQIANMNKGIYLDEELPEREPSNFCIGVAGYPEKHYKAPNLITDIRYTKQKIEAGGEYIVTQMFYNNKHYFKYVELCRKMNIHVPIIPGLKILTHKAQLEFIPKRFFTEIPFELTEQIMRASSEELINIGVKWALKQVEELLEFKVPAVHFYVMTDSTAIDLLMEEINQKLSII
ncbi:MAG: methylenetetrahydrofolate reductase [Promethearchaeota archaeon]